MSLQTQLDYYVDRLVVQYRDRPKARQTVAIVVKQAIADDLANSLLGTFDVDTAAGVQLDVVGKYVGVPRNVGTPNPQGYFGLWSYGSARDPALYQGSWDPATDDPAIPAAAGGNAGWWYVAKANGTSATPIVETFVSGDVIFSDGAVWAKETDDNGNGLMTYNDLSDNAHSFVYRYSYSGALNTDLTDEQYRTVIKLQAILNHNSSTLAAIVEALFAFFPGLITVVDGLDMTLTYFVDITVPLSETLLRRFLPKPMGVGINVFIVTPSPSGGDDITTEDGLTITTEDGSPIAT